MITRSHRRACARALAVACVLVSGPIVDTAPVLRTAQVTVIMSTPVSCDVAMVLAVEGVTSPIDHRLEADVSTRVEGVEIDGAERADELKAIGRTRSLTLNPGQPSYAIRYRVRQADDRRNRCPLWLPAVPTDGVSRGVRIQVQLPSGVSPGPSMPAFTWDGTHGTATLGHLPAFVLLPYVAAGDPVAWGVAGIVDAAAVAVFGVATALWLWRRRR